MASLAGHPGGILMICLPFEVISLLQCPVIFVAHFGLAPPC